MARQCFQLDRAFGLVDRQGGMMVAILLNVSAEDDRGGPFNGAPHVAALA
jgi:hypothetical protein